MVISRTKLTNRCSFIYSSSKRALSVDPQPLKSTLLWSSQQNSETNQFCLQYWPRLPHRCSSYSSLSLLLAQTPRLISTHFPSLMANNPGAWGPYSKDCSQGYCSYYCPQWCFFLFPPPPPSPPSSRPLLSPLLIAIITVASTAFVLVAYYLIVAHYRRRQLLTRPMESPPANPLSHVAQSGGLDETLIDKIASHQYRANDGLVLNGSDCSVCLSEFEDGDHIRLLPKCNHAFHRHCIDTWLKSHCNCPLCRAGIFPLPAAASAVIVEEFEDSDPEEITVENVNFTDENVNFTDEINVIEIREGRAVIGRSLSMDSPFRRRTDTDTDTDMHADSTRWSRTLYTVLISPVARMKRSISLRTTLPT